MRFQRVVLVVVRTVTTLTRLLDIASLIERDSRIQLVFTQDATNPAVFGAGVPEALAALDGRVLPWPEAAAQQFDLILAASENDNLHELRGPVLLVPHGLGYQKFYPDSTTVAGMNPERLMRDGVLVPQAIALSHPDQRELLRAACPAALPHAELIGDPCLDRLLASAHRAPSFAEAFGATGRRLVVLASTWGPDSLLGRHPELPEHLVAALPADEYAVAAILHPGIWSMHGGRQVRAWLSRATDAGLTLLGPAQNWQAALLAASCVLSDHSSQGLYAACLGKPLLLATCRGETTVPGSPADLLAEYGPRLRRDTDLRVQVEQAIHRHRPGNLEPVVRAAVAHPGECAVLLAPLLYRMLRLSAPELPAEFATIAEPEHTPHRPGAYLAGVLPGDARSVVRFPVSDTARRDVDYAHLAADLPRASVRQLASAKVLYLPDRRGADLAAALRDWPDAVLAGCRVDATGCTVATRDGALATLRLGDDAAGIDPLLLASVGYLRYCQEEPLSGSTTVRVGERVIAVAMRAGAAC